MRLSTLRLRVLALTGVLGSFPIAAQQLISAKSGLIHYTEGDVKIAGVQSAAPNNGVFQSLANGKELSAAEGRAEILLGPGQFLRLNENTTVRMVSNKLDSTRLDVVKGSVLVEIVDMEKGAPVTLGLGSSVIELRKTGLYRVDATESRVLVYDGEAVVQGNGQSVTAKKGKEVSLGAVFAVNGFDTSIGDEFTRWAQRRAGYIATANVSGARDVYANGVLPSMNNWAFNQWYGMYTYIPSRNMFMSPFGFYYFPPEMAYNGMFWNYLGGGYGFYGMGSGYGYGYGQGCGFFSYYGCGSGYSGYNGGGGYGNRGGTSTGGGAVSPVVAHGPRGPGYSTSTRPGFNGPHGTTASSSGSGYGTHSGPVARPTHIDLGGGGNRGGSGGGYSASNGGGAIYSNGGGQSSSVSMATSSGGGSTASAPAPAAGGAASAASSSGGAGSRSK